MGFAYVALSGVWFVFSVLLGYFAVFGDVSTRGVGMHLFVPLGALLLSVFFVRSFHLTIRDGTLAYRHLFAHRSIRLVDIEYARVDVKIPRGAVGAPYALIIQPMPNAKGKPFAINMKFLSRDNLRALLEILDGRVIDEKREINRILGRSRKRAGS